MNYKLEDDINDLIKHKLNSIGLRKNKDYNTESAMSNYLKESLRGSAKTTNKTNFGKPDIHIERYKTPVIIENKLGIKKLIAEIKGKIRQDDASISNFAVNGALHYARNMIASRKYNEVIAIGIAGDNEQNTKINIYYVYGSNEDSYKFMSEYSTLDFLENEQSFEKFHQDATLSEEEKHEILISGRAQLQTSAKKLNKLMHNHNITAPQRVLYVSGMLLAMQNIADSNGAKIKDGLTPDDLSGVQGENFRDGKIIISQIEEFLTARKISSEKRNLMLASFSEISKDDQRDRITELDPEVSKFLPERASTNKQIFTFIYEYIFKSIDGLAGHIDIMGEMYSEFLKYALGDGKEIGIVLTPPYITKMMAQILNINKNSRVMDLATGSAGFLISSMEFMIDAVESEFGKNTTRAQEKIAQIKREQLLGVELNAEMYTLAATNMILRGDGSSNIQKGNTFETPLELYQNFQATHLLLNPPFSFRENGMPFIEFGLRNMKKGGFGAIIIQDSAGSGKAITTNQQIIKNNTLVASIKMPVDLFQPMAGVQTSIYVFEAGKPHDFDRTVKFIDFRNDGYKRTARALQETDDPTERYADIIKIFKAGKSAKLQADWGNLNEVYIEDFIARDGEPNFCADWNFDQHKKVDTTPKLDDFKKTVGDYLAWEVSQILKNGAPIELGNSKFKDADKNFFEKGGKFEEFKLSDLFNIKRGTRLTVENRIRGNRPLITAGHENTGVATYIGNENQEIFPKNTITIDMFGNVFYRNYSFSADDNILVLFSKNKFLNRDNGLYIASSIQKALTGKYSYGLQFRQKSFLKSSVILPIEKSGEIAFKFMEERIKELELERIKELELERIKELEAYLTATGLRNTKITPAEARAITQFNDLLESGSDFTSIPPPSG